jgi:AhpD family alkylhydroperoxidase
MCLPGDQREKETVMEARLTSPALSLPGALEGLQAFSKAVDTAARQAGVPETTLDLVDLRASQINGCAVCLDMHSRAGKKRGLSDQQLATLAGWRDAPYFDDAERAVLALTEAGTRIADKGGEALPDDLYRAAEKHFDEQGMAAIVARIAAINMWNRLNVITAQPAGEWTAQYAS